MRQKAYFSRIFSRLLKVLAFVGFLAPQACKHSYAGHWSPYQEGRLVSVGIPGSCYQYVKDKVTGLCWLSCLEMSLIKDDECQHFDRAFAQLKLEVPAAESAEDQE